MDIRPIRSKSDYDAALARIEALMDGDPEPGTTAGDELEVLATLVEAYEARKYPVDSPDPIDAVLFRMEQVGLTRKDLEPYIGHSGRVSEVLSRRRALSLEMIRRLNAGLGIPLESLIRPAKQAS